jgi:hypothetical protein
MAPVRAGAAALPAVGEGRPATSSKHRLTHWQSLHTVIHVAIRANWLLSHEQSHLSQHRSVLRYSKIHSANEQCLYPSGAYSVKFYLFYIHYRS